MSDLKPCPFCGCEDIDEYEGDFGNGVYCMMCGAMMGEPIHLEFRTDERVTYEQAVEAWNKRTPEQAIAATLGSGTCEMLPLEPGEYATNAVRCSECGAIVATFDDAHECCEILFCPNCGKAVSA